MKSAPALFLDRDGTVIQEREYLDDPDGVELIPGVTTAMRHAREAGCRLIVVTNQSGLALGKFSWKTHEAIHRRLEELLRAESAEPDGIYTCPHHPNGTVARWRMTCGCRKPAPGLLVQAAIEWKVDLRKSLMVGDRWSDVDAAARAGCSGKLVLTGYGTTELEYGAPTHTQSDPVPAGSVEDAVEPWLASSFTIRWPPATPHPGAFRLHKRDRTPGAR